jgi:hypothetical protein
MSPLFEYSFIIEEQQALHGFCTDFHQDTVTISKQVGATSNGIQVSYIIEIYENFILITTLCSGEQIESSQVDTDKESTQYGRIQINYLNSKENMDSPEEPIAVDIWVVTNGHCVYVNYCVRGSTNNDATYEIITHQFTDAPHLNSNN